MNAFLNATRVALVATLLSGCAGESAVQSDLLLANARVITGTSEVLDRASILIDDRRIVEIRRDNDSGRDALHCGARRRDAAAIPRMACEKGAR